MNLVLRFELASLSIGARTHVRQTGFSSYHYAKMPPESSSPPPNPDPPPNPIKPRRSWHDLLPYTPPIPRRLPALSRPTRYTRADAIPHTEPNPDDGLR